MKWCDCVKYLLFIFALLVCCHVSCTVISSSLKITTSPLTLYDCQHVSPFSNFLTIMYHLVSSVASLVLGDLFLFVAQRAKRLSKNSVVNLSRGIILHFVSKKCLPFLFCHYAVKCWPLLIIFGSIAAEKIS